MDNPPERRGIVPVGDKKRLLPAYEAESVCAVRRRFLCRKGQHGQCGERQKQKSFQHIVCYIDESLGSDWGAAQPALLTANRKGRPGGNDPNGGYEQNGGYKQERQGYEEVAAGN